MQSTDYHALAQDCGFRWLGPEVLNVMTKTSWECENGHQWQAPYSSIGQGHGCPFCAGLAPKIPADYHALAQDRGFRWLGPEVPNVGTKTGWECENGHQWEAVYNSVRQGSGCPSCAGVAPKTPAHYHVLAEERGFRWLGPEVPSAKMQTGWECGDGHEWQAPYSNILQGRGCPFCAGHMLKTPADYHALAEERGFGWLGPEVPNTHTRTVWECAEGHQWEAHYANVLHKGSGCPTCVDRIYGQPVSQVQRDLCEMLNGELNQPLGRYTVDVALHIDGGKIAVEYDAWYWHAGREEHDAQRDEEMIAAGWRVLRVRSNTQLPTRKQLDAAIDHLLAGELRIEIVLDDWGVGSTKFGTD
jgi:very-short-patch-repair endonuclease